MVLEVQFYIRNNPNIYRYLRENSYWYKYSIKELEEEMKKNYKLTAKDKVEKFSDNLLMISKFLEAFR